MEAEREHRQAPPAHATGAVDFVPVEDLSPDESFRLRPDGDVSALATSMGRLGQLAPIEVRSAPGSGGEGPARWQVVAGFRRLAAVRLLARERVLARVHRDLSDPDAWGLALVEALLHEPLGPNDLQVLRERLRGGGVAAWAEELIEEALVRAPIDPALRERFQEFLQASPAIAGSPPAVASPADAPPGEEIVEVTPEELIQDVTARLYALNQDLATAVEAWEDLPVDGRRGLVDQLRYLAALLPVMEAKE